MVLYQLLGPLFLVGAAIGVVALLLSTFLHRSETKAEFVRPGMHGVVGRFGGGKSYFLATVAARARSKGMAVYANIHIEGCEYWRTWEEFLAMPDGCVILMDEAHLVAPVRVRYLPPLVEERLSQLRHHRQVMFWATQHWSMVNARLRRLCFTVWVADKEAGGHRYSQYTGETFPSDGRIRVGKRQQQRLARMRVRRSKAVQASYDTHEDVVVDPWWERSRSNRLRVVRGGAPDGVPDHRDGGDPIGEAAAGEDF